MTRRLMTTAAIVALGLPVAASAQCANEGEEIVCRGLDEVGVDAGSDVAVVRVVDSATVQTADTAIAATGGTEVVVNGFVRGDRAILLEERAALRIGERGTVRAVGDAVTFTGPGNDAIGDLDNRGRIVSEDGTGLVVDGTSFSSNNHGSIEGEVGVRMNAGRFFTFGNSSIEGRTGAGFILGGAGGDEARLVNRGSVRGSVGVLAGEGAGFVEVANVRGFGASETGLIVGTNGTAIDLRSATGSVVRLQDGSEVVGDVFLSDGADQFRLTGQTEAGTEGGKVDGDVFLGDGDDDFALLDGDLDGLVGGVINGQVFLGAGDDRLRIGGFASPTRPLDFSRVIGGTDVTTVFDLGEGIDEIAFSFDTTDVVSVVLSDSFAHAAELRFLDGNGSESLLVFSNAERFTFGDRAITFAELLKLPLPVPLPGAALFVLTGLGLGGLVRGARR